MFAYQFTTRGERRFLRLKCEAVDEEAIDAAGADELPDELEDGAVSLVAAETRFSMLPLLPLAALKLPGFESESTSTSMGFLSSDIKRYREPDGKIL